MTGPATREISEIRGQEIREKSGDTGNQGTQYRFGEIRGHNTVFVRLKFPVNFHGRKSRLLKQPCATAS